MKVGKGRKAVVDVRRVQMHPAIGYIQNGSHMLIVITITLQPIPGCCSLLPDLGRIRGGVGSRADAEHKGGDSVVLGFDIGEKAIVFLYLASGSTVTVGGIADIMDQPFIDGFHQETGVGGIQVKVNGAGGGLHNLILRGIVYGGG